MIPGKGLRLAKLLDRNAGVVGTFILAMNSICNSATENNPNRVDVVSLWSTKHFKMEKIRHIIHFFGYLKIKKVIPRVLY